MMLWVSKKVHQAASQQMTETERPSGRAQKMLDALWAGQCNCAYWHGVLGGLYLPHLRQAVYRHLLEAENLADKAGKLSGVRMAQKEFDLDGQKAGVVDKPDMNICFQPSQGV